MPTVAELLNYYINLIIIQYYDKPKMRDTISLLVEQALADNVTFDVRDGFDIDTAVGQQLDWIGKYVGIARFYQGQNFEGVLFSFVTYLNDTPTAEQTGFSTFADFETKEGSWIQYSDVVSGSLSLSDDDYRVILKLKILQNNINHSHKAIDDGLFEFFGTDIRAESTGDMQMLYFVPASLTAIMQVAIDKDVLPRPMGVGIGYLIVEDDGFWGMGTYEGGGPAFAKGFATYADIDTKEGEMLTYDKLLEVA